MSEIIKNDWDRRNFASHIKQAMENTCLFAENLSIKYYDEIKNNLEKHSRYPFYYEHRLYTESLGELYLKSSFWIDILSQYDRIKDQNSVYFDHKDAKVRQRILLIFSRLNRLPANVLEELIEVIDKDFYGRDVLNEYRGTKG